MVSIGLATADTIVALPRWPSPDGRVRADEISRGGGGPAATAAVTVARLGHSSAIVGTIGTDRTGSEVRAALEAEGVDISHVEESAGPTAESVILVDRSSGTRAILHRPGATLAALSDAAADSCSAARWVHADHAGAPLLAEIDPSRRSIDEGTPIEGLEMTGVGIYAPSADALRARFPGLGPHAAIRHVLAAGARRVVVTFGADGAIAADATGAWRAPGVTVPVVSTLGAGDVFHGALIASMLDGLALPAATRRANVAAALSCAALDGRSGIPTAVELDAALADAPEVEPVILEVSS